jgi:SpoIID/LytB domain protein
MAKKILKFGLPVLLILAAASILVLLYLYKANIIFVKYVEHGLVAGRAPLGEGFSYKIYIDGKPRTFTVKDKSLDIKDGVISFKYRNNTIVSFLGCVKPSTEKIMSRSTASLELEYSGAMKISGRLSVYGRAGADISVRSLGSVIVGAQNISVYRDRKGEVRTIVLDGDTSLDFMRVGIKDQDFKSINHDMLEFSSDGAIMVEDRKAGVKYNIPPGTNITLSPADKGISFKYGNTEEIIKNRVYVIPADSKAMIRILSFKRAYGIPSYRGYFEVTRGKDEDKLKVINEVSLENYLLQVVPSEMPASFGLEALKAQAVAARTYAVSDLLSGRFAPEGFHVDDSTMSQVYNNYDENPSATRAILETSGIVMKYDGRLVDAKYYSTSHGYGAGAGEVWSSDGRFPGDQKHYLAVQSYLLNGKEYDLSSEETAQKFFKDWTLKSYDMESPYFRWKVTLSKEELTKTIEKNLADVYDGQENYVLTLVGNEFKSKRIPESCIGELLDIKVTQRGKGGCVMEVTITGSKGTYKILKELNIRCVIRPRKSDTGSDNDVLIKRIKGKDLKNSSLLPSAFMVFDVSRDTSGDLREVTFFGGGYGHSVGMSQYGAAYLSSRGYTFDRILKTYYKDINIEKMY